METNGDDIIRAIQCQIEAERQTAEQLRRQNDLAEKTLAALQRDQAAKQIRARLAFDTNDKVTGLVPQIERAFQDIKSINQRIAELENWFERSNDILILLLTEKSPQKVAEALQDLEAEMALRETDQRKLLRIHTKNLATLNEQAALHGTQAPLNLLNQIETEKRLITELTESLRGSDGRQT